jgi:hypothetical protein
MPQRIFCGFDNHASASSSELNYTGGLNDQEKPSIK